MARRDGGGDDLDRELQSHLDLEAEDRAARGLSPEQARAAAHRDLGNRTQIRETVREAGRWAPLEVWAKDFGYALRSLSRNPVFAVVAIASLAIGIGANTALFTVMDRMLFRSLPVPEPGRLVSFEWQGRFIGGSWENGNESFSYPAYRELSAATPPELEGIAAHNIETVAVRTGETIERAPAELVSGNYFQVLGVQPALGRLFTAADDETVNGEPWVVLSHDYWMRTLGADPAVVNSTIRINDYPMTVVGVAQAGFRGFDSLRPADLFVPLSMESIVRPTSNYRDRRNAFWLPIFARLSPGVTRDEARNAMAGPFTATLRADMDAVPRSEQFRQRYLNNQLLLVDGSAGSRLLQTMFAQPVYLMFAMVAVLLLIACLNVANLMITRAIRRRRELAIRVSLGASRSSLARLVLMESGLIAAAGGAGAIALAPVLAGVLMRMVPDWYGMRVETALDWRIAGFAAALSVVTALVFGVIPALRASRAAAAPALKSGATSVSAGVSQARLRRALVAGQIALSVTLLVAAGLFAKSLYTLFAVDPGMNTARVFEFSIDSSQLRYTPERNRQLALDLQRRLGEVPGVASVSASSAPVLIGAGGENTVGVEGYQPQPNEDMQAAWNQPLPDFFSTLGVPLLAGRDFTDRDTDGAPRVVIVNESFAKRFYGSAGAALGRHIGFGGGGPYPMEIVGVTADFKGRSLRDDGLLWTFTPQLQNPRPGEITFYLLSRGDPEAVAAGALRVVRDADPLLPPFRVMTLDRQVELAQFGDNIFFRLSMAFALFATLLASIGLYGVTAFSVARRTQEFGIRIALGAGRTSILSLVLGEVVLLVTLGVSAGALLGLLLGRAAESQLFGVRGFDAGVMGAAVALMALVAVAAAMAPAWRGANIDPNRALRQE